MNNDEYNQRLIALEERLAWQDETIDSLDKTVTRLNETVRLQQEQLSWLYRRLENTLPRDAEGEAREVPLVLRHALDGVEGDFTHLAVQPAHGQRGEIHRAGRHGFVGLLVVAVLVFLEQIGLDQETQRFADFGRADFRAAGVGERKRLRPRHRGSQFAEHRVLPAFEKAERLAIDDFGLVGFRDGQHSADRRPLLSVALCVVEVDHLDKEFAFVFGQVHGLGHAFRCSLAQVEAPLAYVLEVDRRRESGHFCKLLPGECGSRLPVGVVVRDVLAVALVFKQCFHCSS